MRPKSVYFLAIALVLLLSLACQISGLPSANGRQRQNSLYLDGSQPQTLDPALTHGGPAGELGHIFSGLVSLDQQMALQPELAAGWTVSEDGLLYTFYLRKNALFHNGRGVTSADVIYSWERAAHPDTGSDTAATYLGDIDGVQQMLDGQADHIRGLRAIDDHTLEVRLSQPVVYFLQKLAYPVAFVVDHENVSQPNWQYEANGTGPYRLNSWQDDDHLILQRFDSYYLSPAHIEYIHINLGPGLSLARYEQRQIDLVGIGGANLERARDPNSQFYAELHTAVSLCTSSIGLNNRIPPFDNPLVRQAFNLAIDRDLLISAFYGGNALPAYGALPPAMPGYQYRPPANNGYDPELARQLLVQAGYSDMSQFPELTYTSSGYGDVGAYETAVIAMWQENLGVQIQPQLIDPYLYYDEIYAGNIGHFYSSGWCADYPDPQNFLDVLYHSGSVQNIGGYSSTAVDSLLEQARTETDVPQRLALYSQIEAQIVADAPVIFLTHGLTSVLVNPEVENFVLTPFDVRQWHLLALNRR